MLDASHPPNLVMNPWWSSGPRVSFAPASVTDRSKRPRLSSPPPPADSDGDAVYNHYGGPLTAEERAVLFKSPPPSDSPPYIPTSPDYCCTSSPTSSQTLASPRKNPQKSYNRAHKSPRPSSTSPSHSYRAPVTPEAFRERWELKATPDAEILRTIEDNEAIARCLTWYLSLMITGYDLKDGMSR